MAEEKKFLDLLGTSYLKDKIVECLKDYTGKKVSEIITYYDSIYNFPNVGNSNYIYIDKSANKTYRWDDNEIKYYCIGSDYNEIDMIDGGNSTD